MRDWRMEVELEDGDGLRWKRRGSQMDLDFLFFPKYSKKNFPILKEIFLQD